MPLEGLFELPIVCLLVYIVGQGRADSPICVVAIGSPVIDAMHPSRAETWLAVATISAPLTPSCPCFLWAAAPLSFAHSIAQAVMRIQIVTLFATAALCTESVLAWGVAGELSSSTRTVLPKLTRAPNIGTGHQIVATIAQGD